MDLGRADGDHRRRQTHTERERAGVDVGRTVHAAGVLPHGRSQAERRDDVLVAEAQVLLTGEGRVDVDEEALNEALRGAPGHLDRVAGAGADPMREQSGTRIKPLAYPAKPPLD